MLVEHSKELIEEARRDGNRYSVKNLNEQQFKDFVERIKVKTKLSEEGVSKVIQMMNDKYGFSKWGFVNSLTEVAQDYTLERRIEIEKVAGDVLMAA